MHWIRGALAVEAGRMEDGQHVLPTGVYGDGLDRGGDPHRQHAACMEGLPPDGIVAPQSTRHRVDLALWACLAPLDGPLDLVKQGHDRTRIARVAVRHEGGKNTTGRRFGDQTRFAATLSQAIALAFDHRGHGGLVGIGPFTVAALLAVGKLGRWLADRRRAAQCGVARLGYTRALAVAPRGRLGKEVLGVLPQCWHGLAKCQEFLCRVAHPFHQDGPVPAALAAKAPQDFFQLLVPGVGLRREARGAVAACLREVFDERQGFFCAFYSVVASVTRWLPCALGKVSSTR